MERATETEGLLSDGEFVRQWRKRQEKLRGIVALKGFPCTAKTRVAELLGEAATLPVLSIDDFLGDCKGELSSCPSCSVDNLEILQRLAFKRLCAVAAHHLLGSSNQTLFSCVVTKSRLNSTFELDRLLELLDAVSSATSSSYSLIIIECKIRNKNRWQERFQHYVQWYEIPTSWYDFEEAMLDHTAQSQVWEEYLTESMSRYKDPESLVQIRRLVVDPVYDLSITPESRKNDDHLPDAFIQAIRSLKEYNQFRSLWDIELSRGRTGSPKNDDRLPVSFIQAIKSLLPAAAAGDDVDGRYTVEYDQVRRSLWDNKLSRGRSGFLCPPKGNCAFEYYDDEDYEALECCCGVCEEPVVSGPAYSCLFCTLSLHKSCAEAEGHDFKRQDLETILSVLSNYTKCQFPEKHACNSCKNGEAMEDECRACLFQTHLKCGTVPTVLNHDSHNHPLSIQLAHDHGYICKACGASGRQPSYGCDRCSWYCHLSCAFLPQRIPQSHGGYDHDLQLMYLYDDQQLDEYVCIDCFCGLDQQVWFYNCSHCSYSVHLNCTRPDY